MKRFEAELLKDDWTQVRPDVEVKTGRRFRRGDETYILSHGGSQKRRKPFAIGFPYRWRML